jgi:predicted nucleic acid-binding protein
LREKKVTHQKIVSAPLWLDSSAVLAWFRADAGSEQVVAIVTAATNEAASVSMSQISLLEIAKAVADERGQIAARHDLQLLRELAIAFVPATDEQCIAAGFLRSRVNLSTADAIIATQALEAGATLVHKDPEFDGVPALKHRRLPYKTKAARKR